MTVRRSLRGYGMKVCTNAPTLRWRRRQKSLPVFTTQYIDAFRVQQIVTRTRNLIQTRKVITQLFGASTVFNSHRFFHLQTVKAVVDRIKSLALKMQRDLTKDQKRQRKRT